MPFFISYSHKLLVQSTDEQIIMQCRAIKFFENTQKSTLFYEVHLLFLQRFFIGYWILKTGLDFYPGPFFYLGFMIWDLGFMICDLGFVMSPFLFFIPHFSFLISHSSFLTRHSSPILVKVFPD